MAPRVISLRCQNSDAIGREADMPRASRACRCDENDPNRTNRALRSRSAAASWPTVVCYRWGQDRRRRQRPT